MARKLSVEDFEEKLTNGRNIGPCVLRDSFYGSAVPSLVLTSAVSLALITPLAFTSERKFVAPTGWPMRDFVCATFAELTTPFPVASPISTPIGTEMLP